MQASDRAAARAARLFVGIELPEEVRRAVADRLVEARAEGPPARWVAADRLHLTLLFIGGTDRAEVGTIGDRIAGVVDRHPPVRLRLTGGGTFPERGAARILYVGVSSEPDLDPLHRALRHAVSASRSSVRREPTFRPHVTVARCRRRWPADAARRFVATLSGDHGPTFRVERVTLFESILGRGPATHVPLAHPTMGSSR